MDEVLEFINRRFQKDCDWLNGNCYYFAIILKDRFPEGEIYYDVIDGHFLFKHSYNFYDATGLVFDYGKPIQWNTFSHYDENQYKRVVQDCIK